MRQTVFADRGQIGELAGTTESTLAGSSRLGWLRVTSSARSIWVQMRGHSCIDSREGKFHLQRGDWIVLAGGSLPELRSGRLGLMLGLVLPEGTSDPAPSSDHRLPLIGRGTMSRRTLSVALRLWREAARVDSSDGATRAFVQSISHAQQDELFHQLSRCPGRSFGRKREWFERLQRVVLYLDGNSHRTVRISELATIASCSVWHLQKTFRDVYGSNPSSIAQRHRHARARHLLISTSLAITEVSSASGFDSPAAFARAFRSENGMTASQYRAVRRAGREIPVVQTLRDSVDA